MRILIIAIFLFLFACSARQNNAASSPAIPQEESQVLRKHILEEAAWAMQQQPITVTAQTSRRSAGGKHDFF